jgi:hypothetical protein
MMIVITANGTARCLYSETIDLAELGQPAIRRASYVETDAAGRWHADLSPVSGPTLGPFPTRSAALTAEAAWLETNRL